MNSSLNLFSQYKKVLLTSALGLCFALPQAAANEHNAADSNPGPKWGAKLELNAKAGNKRHIGAVSAFAPVLQSTDQMLYIHLNFMADSKKNQEGNFGLGYRQINRDLSLIWGAYGYFDRRSTKQGNTFNQITAGFEVLSDTWEGRANFYLPQKKKKIVKGGALTTLQFKGHNYVANAQAEVPLRGLDLEVGRSLPGLSALRVFVGGYFFQGRDTAKGINGLQARATYKINDYVGVETSVSHDKTRKTNVFGGVVLSLKLGGVDQKNLTAIEKRMEDLPVRDIDIVTGSSTLEEVLSTNHQHILDKSNTPEGNSNNGELNEDIVESQEEAGEKFLANKENDIQQEGLYNDQEKKPANLMDQSESKNEEENKKIRKPTFRNISFNDRIKQNNEIIDCANSERDNVSINSSSSKIETPKTRLNQIVENGTFETPYIWGSSQYFAFAESLANLGGASDMSIHVHYDHGQQYTYSSPDHFLLALKFDDKVKNTSEADYAGKDEDAGEYEDAGEEY